MRRRTIIMIWDGLRPDMVTPETTPRLHAFAASGVRFTASHAIFPTVTRCNSATIATGGLPATHGMPGNDFVLPGPDGELLTSANGEHLERLRAHRGGRLLLRTSVAELVDQAGGRSIIVGTGSPGASLLLHAEAPTTSGLIYNQGLWVGTTREEMEREFGAMPAGALPNTEQNVYFTHLITEGLLARNAPDLIAYWHTDPDRTEHVHGVGHPITMGSIRDADDNLGTILDALDRLGLADSTNVIVISDHGFSTLSGPVDIAGTLVATGAKNALDSTDVVVGSSGIYVREGGPARVEAVVRALQGLDGVGCIFSGTDTGGDSATVVSGTLPLAVVAHGGEMAPDVLYSLDWTDDVNEHGYPGTRPGGGGRYAANHGALSTWEVRNTLIAAGPDFKRGLVDDVPAGNADLAPTLLQLMGLKSPDPLDGRVLEEALVGGPPPDAVTVERETLTATHGRYDQRVHVSRVGNARYVGSGDTHRRRVAAFPSKG